MWPDYIGLDPEPVRSLAKTTISWQDSIDEALASIAQAETLIEEPVGVTNTLVEVANDGRSMGQSMQEAIDKAESFFVDPYLSASWTAGMAVPQAQSSTAAYTSWDATSSTVYEASGSSSWTGAMDGFVPNAGKPTMQGVTPTQALPIESPLFDPANVIKIDRTVDDLAAQIARLDDMLALGIQAGDPERRAEVWTELNEIGRTVTYDESAQLDRATGTWVNRVTADVAHEWEVDYGEAELLHRRAIILEHEPTVPLHDELMAISVALNHRHLLGVTEPVVEGLLIQDADLALEIDEPELDDSLLDPFRDSGGSEWSWGTSRREYWIERTRVDAEIEERAKLWAEELGVSELEATLELVRYRALADKGINDRILAHSSTVIRGENAPRVILETEARRLFSNLELRALEQGWSADQLVIAHTAAIEELGKTSRSLGYPDSDENSQQLAIAYAFLVAEAHNGVQLPSLSQAELDIAVASGSNDDEFTALNNQVLAVSGALSNASDANLAKGLTALATMTDATSLLIAIAEGDEETIREKTADLAIGGLVTTAGRWLLPRVAGGPVVAIATLLLAITNVGPAGDPQPFSPPATGATNEFGVLESSGPCTNAAGFADPIACGG